MRILSRLIGPGGVRRGLSSTALHQYYTSEQKEIVKSLKGKSLLRIDDYTPKEMSAILSFSSHIKHLNKTNHLKQLANPSLKGESIAMIFQKRSTRTRVSTETGASLLGCHSLFLGAEDVQLGVNESLRDTAQVLSRYNSFILARVFGHEVGSFVFLKKKKRYLINPPFFFFAGNAGGNRISRARHRASYKRLIEFPPPLAIIGRCIDVARAVWKEPQRIHHLLGGGWKQCVE